MAHPPHNATKRDLIRTIADRVGMTQTDVRPIVEAAFESLIEILANEHRLELRGFGVFEVRRRAGRTGRNPRTGKTVSVKPRWHVTFKPGKEMEARVARPGSPDT